MECILEAGTLALTSLQDQRKNEYTLVTLCDIIFALASMLR